MPDYKSKALICAETIGVYEYTVIGNMMTYWSFYPECGFIFVTHNLDTGAESREVKYPWEPERKIPPELIAENGSTLYNYCTG